MQSYIHITKNTNIHTHKYGCTVCKHLYTNTQVNTHTHTMRLSAWRYLEAASYNTSNIRARPNDSVKTHTHTTHKA